MANLIKLWSEKDRGDTLTAYDYETKKGAFRVLVYEFGTYDEDTEEELIGTHATVEIIAPDATGNENIENIYKVFDETGDFELYLDTVTDYISFINTRNYIDITSWRSPDDIEAILNAVVEILGGDTK